MRNNSQKANEEIDQTRPEGESRNRSKRTVQPAVQRTISQLRLGQNLWLLLSWTNLSSNPIDFGTSQCSTSSEPQQPKQPVASESQTHGPNSQNPTTQVGYTQRFRNLAGHPDCVRLCNACQCSNVLHTIRMSRRKINFGNNIIARKLKRIMTTYTRCCHESPQYMS